MDWRDGDLMARAARLALRGHGGAEPNPMVGCLMVARGEVVGFGHHRRCGGPHAEMEALRRAGARAAGATAYVTLEPCNHQGRTGPCTEALIDAGVRRCVIGQRDPNPVAGGGAQRLQGAGIEVEVLDVCAAAAQLNAPHFHRLATGLPWVVGKWAQTIDGRVATRTGESRWISSARSRRLVHRERGRVDAILTGIGTVKNDDPLLTARGVRVRRVARRVVIDPALEIRTDAQLVKTAREVPTIVACRRDADRGRAEALSQAGVEVLHFDADGSWLDLRPVLRTLVERHQVASVLVESGPGLMGRLLQEDLLNEIWVFVAPILLADEQGIPAARGLTVEHLDQASGLRLIETRQRGDDVVLRYLRSDREE
jgi:diaminohydroxyphosphoribosylaminopyrimidine deaminase/5-amino-6-(5-phosphoribosylamino)uracil reductase